MLLSFIVLVNLIRKKKSTFEKLISLDMYNQTLYLGLGKNFFLAKIFKDLDLCIVEIFKSDFVSSLENILVPVEVCLCRSNIVTDLLSLGSQWEKAL